MTKLIMLSGLPGSGKSTYRDILKNKLENTKFLSSDDLRIEMFGFLDQTRNNELWTELYKRASSYSKQGYDVVIDSLAITQKDRRRALSVLRKYFEEVECIQIITPLDIILETNKKRYIDNFETYIPEDILRNKIVSYEFPMVNEDFDRVEFVYWAKTNKVFSYTDYMTYEQDNPHHNETLGYHISTVVNNVPEDLRLAALYHDSGKVYSKKYNNEKGYSQFLGHANVSTYVLLTDYLSSLKSSTSDYMVVPFGVIYDELYRDLCLVKYHDITFNKSELELREYFKNKKQLGNIDIDKFVNDLLVLHKADIIRRED